MSFLSQKETTIGMLLFLNWFTIRIILRNWMITAFFVRMNTAKFSRTFFLVAVKLYSTLSLVITESNSNDSFKKQLSAHPLSCWNLVIFVCFIILCRLSGFDMFLGHFFKDLTFRRVNFTYSAVILIKSKCRLSANANLCHWENI